MDRDHDPCLARLSRLEHLGRAHGVLPVAGKEGHIAPDPAHRGNPARVPGVVEGHPVDAEQVAQPAGGLRVVSSRDVVGGGGEEIDSANVQCVAGVHVVVAVRDELLHARGSDDDGVRLPHPFDVPFGEDVEVWVREEDEVCRLLGRRYSVGIDVDRNPAPAHPYGELTEPSDSPQRFSQEGARSAASGARGGRLPTFSRSIRWRTLVRNVRIGHSDSWAADAA